MKNKLLGYSLLIIGFMVSGCASADFSGMGSILSAAGSAIPVPGVGAGLSALGNVADLHHSKVEQQREQQKNDEFNAAALQNAKEQEKIGNRAIAFFQQELPNANPTEWQQESNKINLGLGERTIEKSFDQVYDSTITALANLGIKIDVMEKASGTINAAGNPLPPDLKKNLDNQKIQDYMKITRDDPAILKTQWSYTAPNTNNMGLLVRILDQGKNKAKVKLRITRESYPPYATEVYNVFWKEMDKQLFLDASLDH